MRWQGIQTGTAPYYQLSLSRLGQMFGRNQNICLNLRFTQAFQIFLTLSLVVFVHHHFQFLEMIINYRLQNDHFTDNYNTSKYSMSRLVNFVVNDD